VRRHRPKIITHTIYYTERGHLGDPGVDERIILIWIFRKWDVGVRTGLSWLRIRDDGHL
jgi:hypothetical protein